MELNERIKSLLAQAHLEAVDLKDTNWIANRFAELIVRECASVEHYWLSKEDKTAVALRIKEHFGVEE